MCSCLVCHVLDFIHHAWAFSLYIFSQRALGMGLCHSGTWWIGGLSFWVFMCSSLFIYTFGFLLLVSIFFIGIFVACIYRIYFLKHIFLSIKFIWSMCFSKVICSCRITLLCFLLCLASFFPFQEKVMDVSYFILFGRVSIYFWNGFVQLGQLWSRKFCASLLLVRAFPDEFLFYED